MCERDLSRGDSLSPLYLTDYSKGDYISLQSLCACFYLRTEDLDYLYLSPNLDLDPSTKALFCIINHYNGRVFHSVLQTATLRFWGKWHISYFADTKIIHVRLIDHPLHLNIQEDNSKL